jgi:hypothetical protein
MHAVRTSPLFALIGIVIFCTFAGDIVADSIADLRGHHCTSQCSQSEPQHEKAPCSNCSCAVHNGSVIASNNGVHVSADTQPSAFILITDEPAQVGPRAAIDHPPQLA